MRSVFTEHSITLHGPFVEKMTDQEFADFCHLHRELRIERTAERELILMPPTYSDTGRRNARLGGLLFKWFEQNPQTGEIFDSNSGFRLPDGSMRSPDAAWVSAARWQALTDHQREAEFAPLCPEFIVELKSKTDSLTELQQKMTKVWLANGAQLAFLLVPETQTSYVYRAGRPEPEIVEGFDRELSGEPVLPGFRLDLRMLK